MDKQEWAKKLLLHYFEEVSKGSRSWSNANKIEVGIIVDCIIDAAVEIAVERSRIDRLMEEGIL